MFGVLIHSTFFGIDFMRPFLASYGKFYVLFTTDYVSKWVEAKATKTNDSKVVVDFVKTDIFAGLGTPTTTISGKGTHF